MALNYYKNELKENAQLLASKGKGILAVDESTKTCLLYTSPSPRD